MTVEIYEYDEVPFVGATAVRVDGSTVAVLMYRELGERVKLLLERGPVVDGEALARRFHESYERLAPRFGYQTRRDSAKPWEAVPQQNRDLMTAVCEELLAQALVTKDQFQEMCHDVPPDDSRDFRRGCREYWKKIGLEEPRYATVYGQLWEFSEERYMDLLGAIIENRPFCYEEFGERVGSRVEELGTASREQAGKILRRAEKHATDQAS